MATPSSDEIAQLIADIRDLKNSLDVSSNEVAAIATQYNAAVTPVVSANGAFDPAAWANLTEADQATRASALAGLKQSLLNVTGAEPIVRAEPKSIMYKTVASNRWILILTFFGFAGLFGDLFLISRDWTEATSGLPEPTATPTPSPSVAPVTANRSSPGASPSAKSSASATASTALATTQPTATTIEAPATTLSETQNTTASRDSTMSPAGRMAEKAKIIKPSEGTVLYMVMLLGALGGFLRLASSLANYVGNRQLLQSWIIYYFLTPIQGAALAPIIYLLLRVGVLNPANPSPGSTGPTDSLNLIGIYAFAALTGLFSKQAIETLADVFSTIFKKVGAKDALEKSKPDAATPKDKPVK